jgi:hypothetical protein
MTPQTPQAALAEALPQSIDNLWLEVERLAGLPDDGIVDWSVTLWHDTSGWHASAWRSDTTDDAVHGHDSARAALKALANSLAAIAAIAAPAAEPEGEGA